MIDQVRAARVEDAPALVRLVQQLAETMGDASSLTEAYARDYLTTPGQHVLLTEVDGQAVGLLSYGVRPNLYHAADSALIEELVVDSAFQGQGVGSALMAVALERLRAVGCAEVAVSTMPDNERAQRFYRSHGLVDQAVLLEKHWK
jgi:ribosomal protein S18 acetylase RimI-like enzyme